MEALPRRRFGKSDVFVSALGLGGHHLGDAESYEVAERIVHGAIAGGIDFFDNCWEYHNGRSEEWLGRALAGRRDKVFLMTKVCTHGRGKDVALRMLEESLRRLRTDHLDLWQIHGVAFEDEPERARAAGGVFEALDVAKKQGKVRFVGFTGHKSPAMHLRMLNAGYAFDAVQMPLNPFDASFRSFTSQVLPELQKRGIAALGMKPMNGHAEAIKKGVLTAEAALRYAMSLPVTTTISGIDTVEVLDKNLAIARSWSPLSTDAMQKIKDDCAKFAADGRFELYKVSLKYDNPQARREHGFPDDLKEKEIIEEQAAVRGEPMPQ
jgi:aryl-alcohol dehydrogenase-like predicted oxidoreductase